MLIESMRAIFVSEDLRAIPRLPVAGLHRILLAVKDHAVALAHLCIIRAVWRVIDLAVLVRDDFAKKVSPWRWRAFYLHNSHAIMPEFPGWLRIRTSPQAALGGSRFGFSVCVWFAPLRCNVVLILAIEPSKAAFQLLKIDVFAVERHAPKNAPVPIVFRPLNPYVLIEDQIREITL